MKKLLFISVFVSLQTPAALAQWPVLVTNDAVTSGRGNVQAALGVEYLSKDKVAAANVPLSLLRTFVASVHFGVAKNVNMDLDWKGGLHARLQNGDRGFDWGDLSVATRIQFFNERPWLPAIGVRTAVKLPNTAYTPYGLGNNQTDYDMQLLLAKHFGSLQTRMNIGFGIIGDPRNADTQNDVYRLHIAALLPLGEATKIFTEFVGVTGYFENDEKLVSRSGLFQDFGLIVVGVYSSVRLGGNETDVGSAFDLSENWSVGLSLRNMFVLDIFD